MEKLKTQKEEALKAAKKLKISIEKLNDIKTANDYNKDDYEITRDSVIHRFEFGYDAMWKFLKDYLNLIHSVTVDPPTPRKTFRTSHDYGLIQQNEFELLLNMARDRNITSHTYNEILANQISERIPQYYKTIKNIVEHLKI